MSNQLSQKEPAAYRWGTATLLRGDGSREAFFRTARRRRLSC
jgi:hypothetical protein